MSLNVLLRSILLLTIVAAICSAPVAHGQSKSGGSGAYCSDCECGGAGLYWTDPCGCSGQSAWPQCALSFNGYAATTYVTAEYLALFRDTLNPDPNVNPAPSFDGDFASGVLLTVGTQFAPNYRLETTYFGTHQWEEAGLLPNGNLAAFSSELNNVELTLRHRVPTGRQDFQTNFLIGMRFMDVEDALIINGQTTTARNEMLGIQGGLQLQFLARERTWIDWEMKGTLANNEVAVTGLVQQDVTSFIGETSVVANYQFSPSWTYRIGYRGIWVTGLGLAVENVAPAILNDSGEMAYHGLNVGVVWNR
jgi:hypothetical protein